MTDNEFDGEVIYRCKPLPKVGEYDDIPEEYAVVATPGALSGFVIYVKDRGVWHCNPWSARPLVRVLLAEIANFREAEEAAEKILEPVKHLVSDDPNTNGEDWLVPRCAAAMREIERLKESAEVLCEAASATTLELELVPVHGSETQSRVNLTYEAISGMRTILAEPTQ